MEEPEYIESDSNYALLRKEGYAMKMSSASWEDEVIVDDDLVQSLPGAWIYSNYTKKKERIYKTLHMIGLVLQISGYLIGELIINFKDEYHRQTPFAIHPIFVSIMWGIIILLGLMLGVAIYKKTINVFSLLVQKLKYFPFPVYLLLSVFLMSKNYFESTFFLIYNNISLVLAGILVFYIYYQVKYEDDGRYFVTRLEFLGIHCQYSVLTAWVLIELCESILNSLNEWVDDGNDSLFIGWKSEYWTICIMCVTFALAVIMLYKYRDVFFAGVISYTFFGIVALQSTKEEPTFDVQIVAISFGTFLLGFIVLIIWLYPRLVFYTQRSSSLVHFSSSFREDYSKK